MKNIETAKEAIKEFGPIYPDSKPSGKPLNNFKNIDSDNGIKEWALIIQWSDRNSHKEAEIKFFDTEEEMYNWYETKLKYYNNAMIYSANLQLLNSYSDLE